LDLAERVQKSNQEHNKAYSYRVFKLGNQGKGRGPLQSQKEPTRRRGGSGRSTFLSKGSLKSA